MKRDETSHAHKILFLCHGNICRSPMAEFVMKELVRRAGRDDIVVESAALHTDEIGSDTHHGTSVSAAGLEGASYLLIETGGDAVSFEHIGLPG